MQTSLESIICPHCDKALRPPFWACQQEHIVCPYCHKHQSSSTGELEDAGECSGNIFSLPLLNKMFKNMVDVCQYNCGFLGKLLEIEKHEQVCKNNDKIVKCAIPNCDWYNVISKLVNHVAQSHLNCLVDLQDGLEDGISISLKSPVKLVTQFTKKQLYWLRVDKFNTNKYIMMLYQGRSDNKTAEEAGNIIKYSIKLPESEDVVFSEVIQTANDEFIGDDDFFVNEGTNITSIPTDTFLVYLTNRSEITSAALVETVMDKLECYVCTETMSAPIRMCVRGHSTCAKCAERVEHCPQCKGNITEARNFALEELSIDLSEKMNIGVRKTGNTCMYEGCGYVSDRGSLRQHEKYCKYQETGCAWCGCRVTYNTLLDHCVENHSNKIKGNGVEFVDNFWTYLFSVGNENFILTRPLDDENFYFSVHHLTPKPVSDYCYSLMMSNPLSEECTINYDGRCSACTGDKVKDMEYRRAAGANFIMRKDFFFEDLYEMGVGVAKTLYIYQQVDD